MKHTIHQNHVRKVKSKQNIDTKLTDLQFWLVSSLKLGTLDSYYVLMCIFVVEEGIENTLFIEEDSTEEKPTTWS